MKKPTVLDRIAALSQDEQDQIKRDLEILRRYGTRAEVDARCREDPYAFARTFFSHMMEDPKTGEPIPSPAFHKELYETGRDIVLNRGPFAPDAPARKLGFVAAAPRGHSKSTLISLILVTWALVYRHKRYIVMVSDTDAQAELLGTNVRREFEENDVIRFYFGDMRGDRFGLKWTLRDFIVVHTDVRGRRTWSGRLRAVGTGTSMRGIRERQFRPDLLVGDDLENDEHVESPEMREWLYQTWWSKAVLPMLDPQYGSVIVVGTILHLHSLLAKLLQEDSRYITRKWTCWARAGQPIWPERFPLPYLLELQAANPVAFAQEYENDPRPIDTRLFRPENLRFYTGNELRRSVSGLWTFRGEPLHVFVGVDPAISEAEDACDFAAIVIGITRDQSAILVIQAVITRIDFAAQVEKLVALGQFYDAVSVGIEKNGYQRALAQQTRREIRKEVHIKQLQHHSVGKDGKRRRISTLAPLINNGKLWLRAALPHELGQPDDLGRITVHEDHVKLYQQIVGYPKEDLDDGVDALATAVETAGALPFIRPEAVPA